MTTTGNRLTDVEWRQLHDDLREAYARAPDRRLPSSLDHRLGLALRQVAERAVLRYKSGREPDFDDHVQLAVLKVLPRLPRLVDQAGSLRALLVTDLHYRSLDAIKELDKEAGPVDPVDPLPSDSDGGSDRRLLDIDDARALVEPAVLARLSTDDDPSVLLVRRFQAFGAAQALGAERCPFHLQDERCPHRDIVIEAWIGAVRGRLDSQLEKWARQALHAQVASGAVLDPRATAHRNYPRRHLLGCLAWCGYRVLHGTPQTTPEIDEYLVTQVIKYAEKAGTWNHLSENTDFTSHPAWTAKGTR